MSYTVRFLRGGSVHFTFASPTPFVSPEHDQEHDDQQPPRLAVLKKTWTLEGILYGASEAAVIAEWDALKAKIENPDLYPDGVELVRDSTVVDSIKGSGSGGSYDEFKVERVEVPRSDLAWRGELRFKVRVTGRRRFAASSGSSIAKLTQTETWNYDEDGLLTRTLEGEVEVLSGSAEATARTLGLALPDTAFAYRTNGPEGVDVTKLDRADRKARFVSVVAEAGDVLPSGVGASFSVEREVAISGGEEVTTVRVSARGTGAEAAVKSKRPGGGVASERIAVDVFRRTATATYVKRKSQAGRADSELRLHRFSLSGGGRPRVFTKRTGGRPPVEHVLAVEPVAIVEEIAVVVKDPASAGSFKLPPLIVALAEDTGAWRTSGITRSAIGKTKSEDEYSLAVVRTYRGAVLGAALDAVMASLLSPKLEVTYGEELSRVGREGEARE